MIYTLFNSFCNYLILNFADHNFEKDEKCPKTHKRIQYVYFCPDFFNTFSEETLQIVYYIRISYQLQSMITSEVEACFVSY